jgi:Cd2+/Zn2+-exporting ATPase
MTAPYSFDEFFASNREETVSPFLTPDSRRWGKNLSLRSALFAGLLLACSFVFSFYSSPASLFFLTAVYFLAGTPALINSLHDLSNFEINIDVLMTLAAFLSVVIGSELEGALLLVLFELSASMENMVAQKTRSSILGLHKLSPALLASSAKMGLSMKKPSEKLRSDLESSSKPERLFLSMAKSWKEDRMSTWFT